MTFCRSVLATLIVCALALAGCAKDSAANPDKSHTDGAVGSIAARLTLPDDSEIDSVHYTITGPGMYHLEGDVPVGDSTILTFRVGGIPVANGYTIALDADTSFGNTCMGSSPFDILDNGVSSVTVVLTCGASDNVGDLIVNGEVTSCPVITAISAIPAETTLGHDVSLEAAISHGTSPVKWTGTGGTFGDANAYATTFTCVDAGSHTLTVAVNTTDCTDSRTVDVTCTLGAGCGNNVLDVGEQCDDGNTVDTDGCTNSCHLPVCGDNIISTGEQCDGGNNLPGDGCGATCLNEVCGNSHVDPGETCDDGNTTAGDGCGATCKLEGCGDGTIQSGEDCDDSNNVTETCAYGQTSCTVCDATCHNVAGATAFCGDSIKNGPEACDDGNTNNSDSCSNTCTTNDACSVCREANCHAYFSGSMDAVAGCFDSGTAGSTARADWTASVFTPEQVQQCVDAVSCAHTNHCGVSQTRPAAECYCGAAYPNNGTCSMAPGTGASAPNGLCKAQFETAVGLTAGASPSTVMARIGSVDFPAGWAYNLLGCEGAFCATQCQ